MPFFHYSQNNSGGSFSPPAHHIIVEASTPIQANSRAKSEAGLYFDGDGDCPCCGPRWSEVWDEDEGDPTPQIYGSPVETYESRWASHKLLTARIYFENGTTQDIK